MKKLILLLILISVSGCGLQNQVNDLKDRIGNDEGQINDLRNQISVLEAQSSATVTLLNGVLANVSMLQTTVTALQTQVAAAATQTEADSLQTQIDTLNNILDNVQNNPVNGITALETKLDTNTIAIATLMGYKNIVDFKDPCGPQGSYNEIFLQLSDGSYVASFSDNASGSNTRFAKLTDGNFVTTDGTHCYFTVSGNGTIISNEHN